MNARETGILQQFNQGLTEVRVVVHNEHGHRHF
jgi:hypothetical protein